MIDMQVGLLTLLKEFDAICKKHNITYYLEGGSLLGAVRHKGFLPWDDDIDLSITRDDFKKLLTVIDDELPENRELYCYERFPNYLRDTVKYTNLDTTVLFPNHIQDGNAAGQHIDLFILDPVPADAEKQAEYKKYATIYSELLTPVYVLCDDITAYIDEYNEYLNMIEENGREYVLGLLREKLFTYEDSDECDTYLLRWGNRHIFYPKALFGEPVYLNFEDGVFPAPSQYYRFLRRQFGDSWMIIPEESSQEDHKTYDNFHIPCKTFIEDYSPFIDFEQYWESNSIRKKYNIKLLKAKQKQQNIELQKRFIFDELALEHITCELSQEARKLLEQKNYVELSQYFAPYYTAQLSSVYLENNMVFSVDSDVLYACAFSMIMCGQFGQAEKLLKVNCGLDEKTQELMQSIGDIRSCLLACEEGNIKEAKEFAEKWIHKFPLQLNIAAFLIRQEINAGNSMNELKIRIQELLSYYPQSDELLFLMGLLLTKQGNHNEAEEWYRKCKEITRNGLILMELPEIEELPTDDCFHEER